RAGCGSSPVRIPAAGTVHRRFFLNTPWSEDTRLTDHEARLETVVHAEFTHQIGDLALYGATAHLQLASDGVIGQSSCHQADELVQAVARRRVRSERHRRGPARLEGLHDGVEQTPFVDDYGRVHQEGTAPSGDEADPPINDHRAEGQISLSPALLAPSAARLDVCPPVLHLAEVIEHTVNDACCH